MLKDNPSASTTLPGTGGAAVSCRGNGRRSAFLALVACAAIGVLGGLTSCTAPAPPKQEAARRAGFARLLDAVVQIDVREINFDGGSPSYTSGVGSGVILSEDGVIVTNAHVASPRAVEISVTLANLEWVRAKLVGWDHWTDLAVLQLDMDDVRRRGLTFTHAEFADSDKVEPTQTVFAVGTPFGLTRTVTKGIISNTNRYFEATEGVRGYETGYFNTWLQHDAPISPGNSGGPLVTEDGRVVGINSRVYLGGESLGFAIPSNTAKSIAARLVASGRVDRSYIGLVPGALRDLERFYELAINTGMLVKSVDPGSPAARAGLRAGDVVLAINGEPVDGRFPEQLPPIQNRIASIPIGERIQLQIKRGSQEMKVPVTTELLESRVGEEWAFERWGMSVRKVSRAFAREQRLESEDGVVVIGIKPAFPAEKAGVARGDIITKVNSQAITDLETLKRIYGEGESAPQSLLVEALRNRAVSFFVLKP